MSKSFDIVCYRCRFTSVEYINFTIQEVFNMGDKITKAAVMCWSCMDEMELDMWSDEEEWMSIAPDVAFDDLPIFYGWLSGDTKWDPRIYPTPDEFLKF